MVAKEIPMVTMLEDCEQEEMEDASRLAQDSVVTLLESGRVASGWFRGGLRLCYPGETILEDVCTLSLLCLYAETMLGSPVPLCVKKLTHVFSSHFASMVTPFAGDYCEKSALAEPSDNVCNGDEKLQSSVAGSDGERQDVLEPSFSSSVSMAISQQTVSVRPDQKTAPSEAVSPVSESSQQQSKPAATSSEKVAATADSVVGFSSLVPSMREEESAKGKSAQTESLSSTVESSLASSSSQEDASVVKTAGVGGGGKMVETDPAVTAATAEAKAESSEATASSSQEALGTAASDSASASETQHKEPDAHLETEILLPSEAQLDATSVVSQTLSRPTPVLEVSRASVMGERGKGEMMETSKPSLSPSPTTDIPEAVEDLPVSDVYPNVILPTVEVRLGLTVSHFLFLFLFLFFNFSFFQL
jgi:hypothetical protein